MSDREDSNDRIDNNGSPDGDERASNRSDSRGREDTDREDSPQRSENGHSPRPAGGRSRSSRNHRRSRSRSGSRSRKYSRHSPDEKRPRKRSRSPMSSRRRHIGDRENPPEGRCLGVFGLSIYTQERDLKDVFAKYGPLEDVQIVYDAQTGRSRGFAFVYFESKNDAADAKDRCNGIEIDGRKIRVDFSITQRAHTPTPGIYMGKPTHPRFRGGSDREGGDRGGGGYGRGGRGGGFHRGGGGGGYGGGGGGHHDRRRSPSPYYRRGGGGRFSRSRSRSPHSPRKYQLKPRSSGRYMSSYI